MTDLEINKTIHEKVMGGCWHEMKGGRIRPAKCIKDCGLIVPIAVFQQIGQSGINPQYTSDLNAVYRALDKVRMGFREQNPNEVEFFVMTDCGEYGWLVDVKWGHHDGDVDMHVARNVSLSRALAEAVLKATDNWEDK